MKLADFIFIFAALVLTSCWRQGSTVQQTKITVSAAADLTPAFEEIGRKFEGQSGIKITFNFGSTGQLAQQIESGAPVDLFAAANASFIDELEKKGLIIPETKALYAQGRITIWTRSDSSLDLKKIEDLSGPGVKKIAIANPEHAPYGVAAREALQSAGIWEKVLPKLVYGENVRQTLQYAETGNVDAAIIALSLSIGSGGRWTPIPQNLYRPLDQALAVIKRPDGSSRESEARRFASFINGNEGRAIMRKFGFILPGEKPRETGDE